MIRKYLPYENFIISSRLPLAEVRKRLADNVQPKRTFRLTAFGNSHGKPYEGQIFADSFSISRIINYKNSFLPVVNGQISTFLGKTEIHVKMRVPTSVLIFTLLWLGIVGLVCLGIIIMGIIQFNTIAQNGFSPMILIPFVMFLFGCILTSAAFKAESKRSRQFLERLWEAQEVSDY